MPQAFCTLQPLQKAGRQLVLEHRLYACFLMRPLQWTWTGVRGPTA